MRPPDRPLRPGARPTYRAPTAGATRAGDACVKGGSPPACVTGALRAAAVVYGARMVCTLAARGAPPKPVDCFPCWKRASREHTPPPRRRRRCPRDRRVGSSQRRSAAPGRRRRPRQDAHSWSSCEYCLVYSEAPPTTHVGAAPAPWRTLLARFLSVSSPFPCPWGRPGRWTGSRPRRLGDRSPRAAGAAFANGWRLLRHAWATPPPRPSAPPTDPPRRPAATARPPRIPPRVARAPAVRVVSVGNARRRTAPSRRVRR